MREKTHGDATGICGAAQHSFYNKRVQSLTAARPDIHQNSAWRRWAASGLLGWHLCSLDAPTVAVAWAFALARLADVQLRVAEALMLAIGTWIVYVLDRVLDGWPVPVAGEGRLQGPLVLTQLKDRHRFHHRHRRVLVQLCAVAGLVLAGLCLLASSRLVLFYLLLSVPVAAYAVRVHGRLLWPAFGRRKASRRSGQTKEAAVALLFTAAVSAPAWVGASYANRSSLLMGSLLAAALFWLNCMSISHAEVAGFEANEEGSRIAKQSEHSRLAAFAVVLGCAAGACGWLQPWGGDGLHIAQAVAAVMLSSLLLLALLLAPCGARRFRVLADLALLTPLLFLSWRR